MKKNILVFDSGVGGLSILAALQTLMPEHNYSYLADNGACPYGEKTDAFLQTRIIDLFTEALKHWPADIAVIACNTASTLLLTELRSHFDIDFIGVVPAIKPAAKLSTSKHLALLATKATTSRGYVKQLENDFASDCRISYLPSPELVNISEQKLLLQKPSEQAVANIISQFSKSTDLTIIDTVILGCTHFSFIKDEIHKVWPGNVVILDSCSAVAKRCQYITHQQQHESQSNLPALLMLTSAQQSSAMQTLLAGYQITQLQLLQLKDEQNNMQIGAFAKN